jgi:exodeoxyribonuclease VII large subunit
MRDRDVHQMGRRLERAIRTRASLDVQRLDRLRRRLESRDLARVTAALKTRLSAAEARLTAAIVDRRHAATARVATLGARLDALSPLAVLGRGYAVCWNEGRNGIIRSADAVAPGDTVHVTLAEGELACRVESTRAADSR